MACFLFQHRAISMSAQELSDPDAWKGHCIQLLDNLLASDDSTPFRQPVNMDEYPVSKCHLSTVNCHL